MAEAANEESNGNLDMLSESEKIKQTNDLKAIIEKEVNEKALFGVKEPISSLLKEYDAKESPEYFEKTKELATKYNELRRVRGDGNCFYRAVISRQFEICHSNPDELKRFSEKCSLWKDRLLKLGFPEMTTEDFCDMTSDYLAETLAKQTSQEVEDYLNQDGESNYHVVFARLAAAGFLMENSALYEGFLEGGQDMKQFCESSINPMYKDADHLAIIATVQGLGISATIEYFDRSASPEGSNKYELNHEEGREPIYLLYRPGHYDILYK